MINMNHLPFYVDNVEISILFFLEVGTVSVSMPGVPQKRYTTLKSKIFVQRRDQSVKLVSFVGQVLSLDFDT